MTKRELNIIENGAIIALLFAGNAVAADLILPGSDTVYGAEIAAVHACAVPVVGRAKVIELISEPGNCVTVRYVSLGKRSCSYSFGPGSDDDTRHALRQLCESTTLPASKRGGP